MDYGRTSLGVFAAIGLLAAALAGATIWLLVTDPVTVADAVATGEITPVVRALAALLYEALRELMGYL
jgi:putative flippase GtrA